MELYAVKEIVEPIRGVRTLHLKPKDGAVFGFQPGQYVFLHLLDEHGASLDKRAFSIASSPSNREFLEVTFRLASPFTQKLFELRPGDAVGVEGPLGEFVWEEGEALCVFIAGGVGVTPIASMVRYACERAPNARLVLLYSSKSKDIVYQREFEELAKRNPNLKVVFTVPDYPHGWRGETRFIDKALIHEHVPDVERACVFVCGPPPMVEAVKTALRELGVPDARVRFERF